MAIYKFITKPIDTKSYKIKVAQILAMKILTILGICLVMLEWICMRIGAKFSKNFISQEF